MRPLIITFLFCGFVNLLHATHNRAGEITYEQIGSSTIQATITTYTQTSSIPADRDSLMLCWGDGNCEKVARSNENGFELPNDYKVNYYTAQHTYTEIGTYQLSMTDPNRNDAILNVNPPNSVAVEFHLQTTFTLQNLASETNQSPTLLIAPIDVGFIRQPFMHTPNAVDLDGDSIAYELVTPLSGLDLEVPNYIPFDQIGSGTANSYTFNEQTGLLIWDSPQIVGQYNIAIKIKSYRDGILHGEMIRDMQILIKPEANTPPFLQGISDNLIEVKAEQSIDLSFIGTDNEDGMGDLPPNISVVSEALERGATVEYNENFDGTSTSDFKWTPTQNDSRSTPYQITVKAVDSKGLATFKVIQVVVNEFSTSVSPSFQQLGFELFPNPASTQVQLVLPDNQINQVATITIFDNLGRLVYEKKLTNTPSQLSIPTTNLAHGNYIIHFKNDATIVSSILMVQ